MMTIRLILLILLLLSPSTATVAEQVLTGPVPATVLKVIDGDTLEVRAHIWLGQDIITRVRINGIDTPELNAKCPVEHHQAKTARTILHRLIAGQNIILTHIHYGKYAGRVVANVITTNGIDVSSYLVKQKLARPYNGRKRHTWC